MKTLLSLIALGLAAYSGLCRFVAGGQPHPPQPPTPPLPPDRPESPATCLSLLGSAAVGLPLGYRFDLKRKEQEEPAQLFAIDETHLSHHALILGTTGTGKSRLGEGICRNLMRSLRGFCYIDPHSDTVENLAAYATKLAEELGTDAIYRQIYWLELGFDRVFSYDHFKPPDFSHLPPEAAEVAYRSWLDVRVDQFSEVVNLNQGDAGFQGMALLQRCLRDCLYAVGVAVDANGNHLALSDVFAVLDSEHKRHKEVFALVKPHLPPEVAADIERWDAMSREQRMRETMSTLNRLRAILSPIVQACFADTANTIDFRQAVRDRKIVLVSVRVSDFLSATQRDAIVTLIVHALWSAVQTEERENRSDVPPYYLFLDEAPKFVNKDFAEILSEGRKFRLSICLIGQHLSQFEKGDVSLIDDVLSLCNTFVCFRQKNPKDLAVLKEYFGYPNLDFTELFTVQDRPNGYLFLKLQELSRNFSRSTNWNQALSLMESDTQSVTRTNSTARSEAQAVGAAHQEGTNSHVNRGASQTVNRDAAGTDTGRVQSGQLSSGSGTNASDTSSIVNTKTRTSTNSLAVGEAHAESVGVKVGEGGGEQEGYSIAYRTQILQQFVERWYPAGRLRWPVQDQLDYVGHVIDTLRNRNAVVSLFGEARTFRMEAAEVPDVFADPREMTRRLREFKKRLYALHPFYRTPDLSPGAQERRLVEFLARVSGGRRELVPVAADGEARYEYREENPLA